MSDETTRRITLGSQPLNQFFIGDGPKRPVFMVYGWQRRHGTYEKVLMPCDEFSSEVRKVEERLDVIQGLLAARSGLTNRERKALDKEQRMLIRLLRSDTCMIFSSWGQGKLRIAKEKSRARQSKARKKKLRWLARKRPSCVSEAELRVTRGEAL